MLASLAGHRDADRWWRICWPPVWWYFGLPDTPASALALVGPATATPATNMPATPDKRVLITRDEYWRQLSQLKAGEPGETTAPNIETVLRLGVARQEHYLYAVIPPSDERPVDARLFATPNTMMEQAGGEELLIAIVPEAPGYLYQLKDQAIVRRRSPPISR